MLQDLVNALETNETAYNAKELEVLNNTLTNIQGESF